ncbi:MAG: thioredoxin domain-containing protein [Planctomycetes bacterium]|nr:thioredoxin domain-containing protein [Planctomycetota bacterium]
MTNPTWRDFDQRVFDRAREDERLVLLTITASWCRFCRQMDRTTFSDARVLSRVAERYVPVRADKDRRPDVNERYYAGGWPTVAVLTPDGATIAASTYLDADALLEMLDEAEATYRDQREELEAFARDRATAAERSVHAASPAPLGKKIVDDVRLSILESFDAEYGGFGQGQKFPHPEAIDFALIHHVRDRDARMGDVVRITLDHMDDGPIHDREGGGFFRFSQNRDWSRPEPEKVLDSNALRIQNYLEAYQTFDEPRYRAVAEETLEWVMTHLLDEETGAYWGSEFADAAYYGLTRAERRNRPAPRVDRTIYSNWNAMMVSTLLRASRILGRPELATAAERTLSFLLRELYSPLEGMYHFWDETYHLPGLLTDQAYTLRAIVDHVHTTGTNDHLKIAGELVAIMQERQRAEGGGYYDTHHKPQAPGGLKQRNRSILENSVVAEALSRLAYLMHTPSYIQDAQRTLEAFVRDYKGYGIFVAGYARAVDLILSPPLCVTIVGSRSHETTRELRRAAFSIYVPSRIVQVLDPEVDPELFAKSGYEAHDRPTAYLEIPQRGEAQAFDPFELPDIMRKLDEERRGG